MIMGPMLFAAKYGTSCLVRCGRFLPPSLLALVSIILHSTVEQALGALPVATRFLA
jgi:hypothetical protein